VVSAETELTDAALGDEIPQHRDGSANGGQPIAANGASEGRAIAANEAGGESGARALREASESTSSSRESVRALFDVIQVDRTTDGGVRIEAPKEAAASLLALFNGMASLLASATQAAKGD
jgi:hypothetical protein